MTNKLALVVAVVLGALSIVLIYKRIEGIKREYEQSAQLVPVLVASRTIAAGTVVTPGDVGTIDMPSQALSALAKSYYQTADRNLVENRKALADVKQGQIFQNYHFEQQSQTSKKMRQMAANLRAITVTVNPTNGLAGMLRPGDSIDVIVTENFEYANPGSLPGSPKEKLKVTRTLLRKVPIIATDANTEAASAYGDYTTITLGLTPDDVNRFYHATDTGSAIHFIKTDDTTTSNVGTLMIPDKAYDEVKAEIDRYMEARGKNR